MPKKATSKLIGTFWPDDTELIFNDAPCAAVVVHERMGFNDATVFGVIQICGCEDKAMPASAVLDEAEDGPTYLDASGARRLAALLLKAADHAEALAKQST